MSEESCMAGTECTLAGVDVLDTQFNNLPALPTSSETNAKSVGTERHTAEARKVSRHDNNSSGSIPTADKYTGEIDDPCNLPGSASSAVLGLISKPEAPEFEAAHPETIEVTALPANNYVGANHGDGNARSLTCGEKTVCGSSKQSDSAVTGIAIKNDSESTIVVDETVETGKDEPNVNVSSIISATGCADTETTQQHTEADNQNSPDAMATTNSDQISPSLSSRLDSADDDVTANSADNEDVAMATGGPPEADDDWESMSTSSSQDSDEPTRNRRRRRSGSIDNALQDIKQKVKDIMEKPKPKHSWSLIRELHKRQRGARPSLLHQDKFRLHMYSSLHAVERLELMSMLCAHEGCVNCLHWNQAGDRLASGSDDLKVVVWDWSRQKPAFMYESGHKSNIFEAKFMPLRADTHIVSTSRDGQVRLAEVGSDGQCRSVRRVAQHRGSGRKLALQPDSPHNVLSCGDDAVVFNIDLRQDKPHVLTTCMDDGKKIPINSLAAHPEDPNVFLLACVDKYVRVYDRRMISSERRSYRRLCPHSLSDTGYRYNVTCAQFNYNGTRIAASYNDEDIYLFDGAHSDGADAVHRYSGHRNNATVKGVNFYGPTSQYVVSGSDCGNIFFWDVDSEAIVQFMPGDDNGVVNCLEPHPHIPVLATSGLDDDVKIWVPSRDDPPDLLTLGSTVEKNLRERLEELETPVETLSSSLMWTLMHQVLGSHRRRTAQPMEEDSDDDGDQPGDCRTS